MLSAGVTIDVALETLLVSESGQLAEIINDVSRQVRSGHTLSGAMKKYPTLFPVLAVGLVQAGESAGKLAESLDALADYYEKNTHLKKALIAALTYPCALFCTIVAVAALFVVFVCPSDGALFGGASLPYSGPYGDIRRF